MTNELSLGATLTPETAPGVVYQRHLDEGVLNYQTCLRCTAAVFPPRVLCPSCGATDLAWTASSGLGSVYSVSSIHPRDAVPYHVALIDLDDGFRMMSNVIGSDQVRIGARVRLAVTVRDDVALPLFELEGDT